MTMHSSDVSITIDCGSGPMPVAQIGSGWLYFDSPVDLPWGPATVFITIDGDCKTVPVRLIGAGPSRKIAYVVETR